MNTHKIHLNKNLNAKLQKGFHPIVPLVSNDRFNQLVTNFSTQIERDLQHHLVFTTFSKLLLILESFQDFLFKLDMKPRMHLVEISIFSLNIVIVRLTTIMNNLLEHLKILIFKILYFLKMCPFFVGSVHNFGWSD